MFNSFLYVYQRVSILRGVYKPTRNTFEAQRPLWPPAPPPQIRSFVPENVFMRSWAEEQRGMVSVKPGVPDLRWTTLPSGHVKIAIENGDL